MPQLSVVVAATHAGQKLERWLAAFTPQLDQEKIEVIIAAAAQPDELMEVTSKYPAVRWLIHSSETVLPALWGAGLAQAQAEIIAITDTTCVVAPDWAAAILAAHAAPHLVIGGAVEPGGGKSLVDWAAYFCEYGQFMRPLATTGVHELPGNNIAFKRAALQIGEQYTRPGFWKTYWCRRLQQEGVALNAAPTMVVYDQKSYRLLPFLARRFHHGRCFAGMRVAAASSRARLGYACGSVLLPFLFLLRTVRAVAPKQRYRKEFMLSLPLSLLAILSWSCGECCGYLAGTGESCARIH